MWHKSKDKKESDSFCLEKKRFVGLWLITLSFKEILFRMLLCGTACERFLSSHPLTSIWSMALRLRTPRHCFSSLPFLSVIFLSPLFWMLASPKYLFISWSSEEILEGGNSLAWRKYKQRFSFPPCLLLFLQYKYSIQIFFKKICLQQQNTIQMQCSL